MLYRTRVPGTEFGLKQIDRLRHASSSLDLGHHLQQVSGLTGTRAASAPGLPSPGNGLGCIAGLDQLPSQGDGRAGWLGGELPDARPPRRLREATPSRQLPKGGPSSDDLLGF